MRLNPSVFPKHLQTPGLDAIQVLRDCLDLLVLFVVLSWMGGLLTINGVLFSAWVRDVPSWEV